MEARYSRLGETSLIGPAGLARLGESVAAIVGVGGIGGEAARHWVMTGGNVMLIDRDTVQAENLGTQAFTEAQLGLPKSEARARSLAALNSRSLIESYHADIESLGLGALREADLIFCCLDSRRGRAVVSELAVRLGIPWVDAAVDGTGRGLSGRVAAYDPRAADAACYLCPHDHQSLGEMMREGRARCPVWRWEERESATAPTLAISALGAAIAAIQVMWGLKLLLGQGEEVRGREMLIDLDRQALSLHSLRPNPRCLAGHHTLTLTPTGHAVAETAVAETFAAAEKLLGGEVTLQLHRRTLVAEMRCPACSVMRRPFRILEAMRQEETMCECGSVMQPQALGLLNSFGRREAAQFLKRTWAELGLPARDVVTASNGEAQAHLLFA
jgi:molybdopterin/thiamine biosynthesis adenylyltransferase